MRTQTISWNDYLLFVNRNVLQLRRVLPVQSALALEDREKYLRIYPERRDFEMRFTLMIGRQLQRLREDDPEIVKMYTWDLGTERPLGITVMKAGLTMVANCCDIVARRGDLLTPTELTQFELTYQSAMRDLHPGSRWSSRRGGA